MTIIILPLHFVILKFTSFIYFMFIAIQQLLIIIISTTTMIKIVIIIIKFTPLEFIRTIVVIFIVALVFFLFAVSLISTIALIGLIKKTPLTTFNLYLFDFFLKFVFGL